MGENNAINSYVSGTLLPNRLCNCVSCNDFRPLMRSIFLLTLLAISTAGRAGPIPDLVCEERLVVRIDPQTQNATMHSSSSTYRFISGGMYIKPVDRSEYFYNKVVESEYRRYTSGHKVIQFEPGFETALLVHTYFDEVRVSRVSCSQR